jgi:hypothetical protein
MVMARMAAALSMAAWQGRSEGRGAIRSPALRPATALPRFAAFLSVLLAVEQFQADRVVKGHGSAGDKGPLAGVAATGMVDWAGTLPTAVAARLRLRRR